MITTEKSIHYPEIGLVLFRKSNKAKRLIISIKSPSKTLVIVPKYVSFGRAKSFVRNKVDWIIKHQKKNLNKIDVNKLTAFVSDQDKSDIIVRARCFAENYNFSPNKISLRRMKTRWGSCTQKNNISLNIGLIALPKEYQDYVILHELLHTRIKNHSAAFWKELENFIPHPKILNRKLSQKYGLY